MSILEKTREYIWYFLEPEYNIYCSPWWSENITLDLAERPSDATIVSRFRRFEPSCRACKPDRPKELCGTSLRNLRHAARMHRVRIFYEQTTSWPLPCLRPGICGAFLHKSKHPILPTTIRLLHTKAVVRYKRRWTILVAGRLRISKHISFN